MNKNNRLNFDLIYHKDENIISSFDRTIIDVIKNEDISVICPYIGLNYFSRLTSIAKSWHLITDIEEWILSHNNRKSRIEVLNFIKQNNILIHHVKDVHAKVIITKSNILLGSANLTENGMRNKIELSILIKNEAAVKEINQWFQNLWSRSNSITNDELDKFFESTKRFIPKIFLNDKIYSLPSPEKISKRLIELVSEKLDERSVPKRETDAKQIEDRLIEILKCYPNKKWMNDFLDVVRKMIEDFEIKDEDIRIAMIIPKTGRRLPVNIGQRWIIRPYINGDIGMIMPLSYEPSNFKEDNAVEKEEYYYTNRKKTARWVLFNRKVEVRFSDKIINYWYEAIKKELDRAFRSGRKKYHESIYYNLATDIDYRKKILDKAFS